MSLAAPPARELNGKRAVFSDACLWNTSEQGHFRDITYSKGANVVSACLADGWDKEKWSLHGGIDPGFGLREPEAGHNVAFGHGVSPLGPCYGGAISVIRCCKYLDAESNSWGIKVREVDLVPKEGSSGFIWEARLAVEDRRLTLQLLLSWAPAVAAAGSVFAAIVY